MSDIMITVSGTPKCGKSWLAAHLAVYLWKLGKNKVQFLDENPTERLRKPADNEILLGILSESNILVKTEMRHRPWTIETELQNKKPFEVTINFRKPVEE